MIRSYGVKISNSPPPPFTWQYTLKWSFTHKQDAWEPPQNHSWNLDLCPFQTEILKIDACFAKKMPERVEIMTSFQMNTKF